MGEVRKMLENTVSRTRLHMPGHMGRLAHVGPYDTTEILHSDDLFDPKPHGAYETAQKQMAQSLGVTYARFLTGGATQGIFAMILGAKTRLLQERGEPIRLAITRCAHKSVFHACALFGLDPQFLYPDYDAENDFVSLSAQRVLEELDALDQKPHAVLITAPDYYGVYPDTQQLADALQSRGILLLVDAAHGAHLPFAGKKIHGDLITYSAHKTLPALTGCAILAAQENTWKDYLERALLRVSSTSPSSLLCLSLDEARIFMDDNGTSRLKTLKHHIRDFWKNCPYPNAHAYMCQSGLFCDETRIVIDIRKSGYTGGELLELLAERGVDLEMADQTRLVAITSVMTEKCDLDALLCALCTIERRPVQKITAVSRPSAGEKAMPLYLAMNSRTRLIPVRKAAGYISAVCAGAYPPGIPFVAPGERITPVCAEALADCIHPFGLEDGCIEVVADILRG